MATVLISGGSGFIGKKLTSLLVKKGFEVWWLTRNIHQEAPVKCLYWDIEHGEIDPEVLKADYIIHLAGAGIADKRWTKTRISELVKSRSRSASLIIETFKDAGVKPKAFISAAGTGYYGLSDSKIQLTEKSPAGIDTLAHISQQWEKSVCKIENYCRTVRLRIGMVLGQGGGALEKMDKPIRYFVGSSYSNGKQAISWIHMDDLCQLFLFSIENEELKGVFNAVADETVSNSNFIKALGEILNRPIWFFGTPSIVFKIMLGEMSKLLLQGAPVCNKKIKENGFQFRYTELKPALDAIYIPHVIEE